MSFGAYYLVYTQNGRAPGFVVGILMRFSAAMNT
jgi:hypothetical protein